MFNNLSLPSQTKAFLYCFLILLIYSCHSTENRDAISETVKSKVKKFVTDSIKGSTIITYSNFEILTKYDSIIIHLKQNNEELSRIHSSLESTNEKKELLLRLAPLLNSIQLPSAALSHINSAFENINTSLRADSDSYRLRGLIRNKLFQLMKNTALQKEIVGYQINCTYFDSKSTVHNQQFNLDSQLKMVGGSEL